jgi:hypothetical protein
MFLRGHRLAIPPLESCGCKFRPVHVMLLLPYR